MRHVRNHWRVCDHGLVNFFLNHGRVDDFLLRLNVVNREVLLMNGGAMGGSLHGCVGYRCVLHGHDWPCMNWLLVDDLLFDVLGMNRCGVNWCVMNKLLSCMLDLMMHGDRVDRCVVHDLLLNLMVLDMMVYRLRVNVVNGLNMSVHMLGMRVNMLGMSVHGLHVSVHGNSVLELLVMVLDGRMLDGVDWNSVLNGGCVVNGMLHGNGVLHTVVHGDSVLNLGNMMHGGTVLLDVLMMNWDGVLNGSHVLHRDSVLELFLLIMVVLDGRSVDGNLEMT